MTSALPQNPCNFIDLGKNLYLKKSVAPLFRKAGQYKGLPLNNYKVTLVPDSRWDEFVIQFKKRSDVILNAQHEAPSNTASRAQNAYQNTLIH